MLNKCHKGHWVIIERVVSTVPLQYCNIGGPGALPDPHQRRFQMAKGTLTGGLNNYILLLLSSEDD